MSHKSHDAAMAEARAEVALILERAKATAEKLDRDDLTRIAPLPDDLGCVAYFKSDMGLRCHGQASLIQNMKGDFGLIIGPDGAIPRDAEASSIVAQANRKSREFVE
jgi:hypothetical protein